MNPITGNHKIYISRPNLWTKESKFNLIELSWEKQKQLYNNNNNNNNNNNKYINENNLAKDLSYSKPKSNLQPKNKEKKERQKKNGRSHRSTLRGADRRLQHEGGEILL